MIREGDARLNQGIRRVDLITIRKDPSIRVR
jgi:hypothetical protein